MTYKPKLPYLPLENPHSANRHAILRGTAAGLATCAILGYAAWRAPDDPVKEQTSFTILCGENTEPSLILHPGGELAAPLIDTLGYDTAAIVGVTCQDADGRNTTPTVSQSNQSGNCFKRYNVLTMVTEQPSAEPLPQSFLKDVGTMSLVGVRGTEELRFTGYNLQQAPFALAKNDDPGFKHVPCQFVDITPNDRSKDLVAQALGPSFR